MIWLAGQGNCRAWESLVLFLWEIGRKSENTNLNDNFQYSIVMLLIFYQNIWEMYDL